VRRGGICTTTSLEADLQSGEFTRTQPTHLTMAENKGVEPSALITLATVFKTVCGHPRYLPKLVE